MAIAALPSWTAEGVLPPFDTADPVAVERSPYVVSLLDFVRRFGTSPERRAVLAGYLGYRARLHAAGLVRGFQWLHGSFLEQVEVIEGRPPNDLDVVTFYHLPAGRSQGDVLAAHPSLFDRGGLKAMHHVDAYLADLGMDPERLARRAAYWHSVWSHRRNRLWKGFVHIDLAPHDDAATATVLAQLAPPGASP